MTHPTSCENAHVKVCTCRCGGEFHGIEVQSKLTDWEEEPTKLISLSMGGEIEEVLTSIIGKKFQCWCKHEFDLDEGIFESYGVHDGGHADKTGTKWWIHIHCPKCKYDWALWKIIQNRIPMYKRERKHEREQERFT